MKVEVQDLSTVRKEMSVEFPAEEVDRAFSEAVRAVARKVTIPGFRKGKAPRGVVHQRYAEEIARQVEEDLTERAVREAFAETSILPLGPPELRAPRPVEGESYRFTVRYEVRPPIEPKDYLGQEVARPEPELGDEEVHEELKRMQQAAAYLVPVEDRAAAAEDVAVVDLEGRDPSTQETLRHQGVSIVLGSEGNLPDFDRALEGRRPGETFEADVAYPEDFPNESLRGKTVRYTMSLRELKRREVPALDDDFARDAGDFADLAALRQKVRERLLEIKNLEADRVARERLLGKLADGHDFEVPEALVESQLDQRLEDMALSLLSRGIDPRQHEIDWRKIREEQRGAARDFVKKTLLLDAIAARETLEVTPEELDGKIERVARAHGEKPQAFRKRLVKERKLEGFKNQVLREKCLDFVYRAAKIR